MIMRRIVRRTLLLAVALGGAAPLLVSQSRVLGKRPDSLEWKPLFNGRNLDGWDAPTAGDWQVENGVLVVHRREGEHAGGWLVTKNNYGDFILRLKFEPGAEPFNSGILIRDTGHSRISRPAFNGFEIQLAEDGADEENPNGSIYDVSRAFHKRIDPQKWTDFEVRCIDDHIVSYMNGEKMAETHSRRSYRGGIGFQVHGGSEPVNYAFKDIEIAELPEAPRPFQNMEEKLETAPGTFVPLLDSASAREMLPQSSSAVQWSFTDGVLRGTGSNQTDWVVGKPEFGDFILSFGFRVSGSGYAGVGVRLPGPEPAGNGCLAAQGYEFRISDSDDDNPTGSILDLARAFRLGPDLKLIVHKEQWNQARLYVAGDHIVSYVNLVKMAETHANRRSAGRIGFEVAPRATIEYRDLQVKRIAP
jgi:hypothetical protein